MPFPSQLKKCLISLFIILLLAPHAQAVTAFSGNYTARENPADIMETGYPVDYKTLAVMEDLYKSLGNIALDVNQSNFDKAKIDYSSFKDLYDSNKDVFQRLFDSDADALDAINATDLTVDDIRQYLNDARDYNQSYRLYQDSVLTGDSANITIDAINTKQDYERLSTAYHDLRTSTLATMDRLDYSNQASINSSLLLPFLDTMDTKMEEIAAEQKTIQAINGDYNLTLLSSANEAAIGDSVTYSAVLRINTTDPVQNANIVLYSNGQAAGSGMTDSYGTCSLAYQVPDNVIRNNMSLYVEYVPAGREVPLAMSDTLYLHILDEPTAISSNITPSQATFGDTINVNGSLAATRGFPAIGLPVDIYLSGTRVGSAMTGTDGAYSFSFPITEHMPGGNCDVYAVYRQAADGVFLSSSSPHNSLDIDPRNTSITMAASGVRFTAGDSVVVNGTLTAERGLPVGGANVIAMLDGRQIGANKTDGNGDYTIKALIPYGSASGNHSLYTEYVPANTSLSRSSSGQLPVYVDGIAFAIKANGTQTLLFLNDTLNVTGSLHTNSGIPLRGQDVEIWLSDSIGGTVTTDESGNFYYSRTVNGYDPPGIYEVSVYMLSPDDSTILASATAGRVLVLPVDRTMAMAVIAAILLILAAIVLMSRSGMSIGRLMDLVTGRKKIEADVAVEAPPEPILQVTAPKTPPSYGLDGINALIEAHSFGEASVSMYVAARRMATDHGVTVRDSDTHREFYRTVKVSNPSVADSLRTVVETYERMRYGHRDSSLEDMQKAFSGLKAIEMAFSGKTGGA